MIHILFDFPWTLCQLFILQTAFAIINIQEKSREWMEILSRILTETTSTRSQIVNKNNNNSTKKPFLPLNYSFLNNSWAFVIFLLAVTSFLRNIELSNLCVWNFFFLLSCLIIEGVHLVTQKSSPKVFCTPFGVSLWN